MKGMGILVMGSALIMVVFVIIMPFVQIFFQPVRGEITNIELRTEAYTMGNALAAAGVYMGSALRFSAYQAMHDTGMQGGWDAIPAGKSFQAGEGSYAIWHNGSDVSPSEDELKASLGKSVAAWLGKYREKGFRFLNDYSVRLPVYSPVLVSEFTGSSFSVSAMPDSRMSIQKGSQDGSTNVLLERTASLQDSFSYPYLELFR
ncbi:MAG: hypothetical protein HY518_05560 [Candidatus Aenigmarchaeota archaeon]|nr:hypothetical protein [Candidatus Aenigmarchaeota archaeon]